MVVDFAIHGENHGAFSIFQRLTTRLRVDNRQALMAHNGIVAAKYARPVGASMANFLRHFQHLFSARVGAHAMTEYTYYSTHKY